MAVTAKFGKSGDLINANLENGEIIQMIVADTKAYGDTGVSDESKCGNQNVADPGCYGHVDGKSISVLEFEVDPEIYNTGKTNPSSWGQEWTTSQKVKSITNYGSLIGSVDTTGQCSINTADPSLINNSLSTDHANINRNLNTDHANQGTNTNTNHSRNTNTHSRRN